MLDLGMRRPVTLSLEKVESRLRREHSATPSVRRRWASPAHPKRALALDARPEGDGRVLSMIEERQLKLHTPVLPEPQELLVRRISGREGLSELFEYQVTLVSLSEDVDFSQVL